MINLIVVIIVGAIIGWVASRIMRTRGGLLVDIVVGIVGALLAGYLFGRATLTSGSFSRGVSAVVVAGRRHPAGGFQAHLPGTQSAGSHAVADTARAVSPD